MEVAPDELAAVVKPDSGDQELVVGGDEEGQGLGEATKSWRMVPTPIWNEGDL